MAKTLCHDTATLSLSRADETPRLEFRDITYADMPEINRLLQLSPSRTCDYTIGGIYMWIDFFHYQYCIYRETLFIKGTSEFDTIAPAFSLPIGLLPLSESIGLLKEYCLLHGIELRFSAIPADRLDEFRALGSWDELPLTDWTDYLYDISAIASLTGKRLSKKRNHVNRFEADNPSARVVPLTSSMVDTLCEHYMAWTDANPLTAGTALEECDGTIEVLRHLSSYPFEGAVLIDGDGHPVAFAVGEVIGDTLYEHIEKMDHRVSGAGEVIASRYAAMMLLRHPGLRYLNREEDVGDEGLRQAKLSWHPSALLAKFDLTISTRSISMAKS